MNSQVVCDVSLRGAANFFLKSFQDIRKPEDEQFDQQLLIYNAFVLGHYASTSNTSSDFPFTPLNLIQVFDLYVLDRTHHGDTKIYEAAATSCLLFTGFFRTQMSQRHNLPSFEAIGKKFFIKAQSNSDDFDRKVLMGKMAVKFLYWRRMYTRLSQELRDQQYLLQPLH